MKTNIKSKIKKLLWMPMLLTPAFVFIGCKVNQTTNDLNNNSDDSKTNSEASNNANSNGEKDSTAPSTSEQSSEVKDKQQDDKGIRYVAFGDSIAAGFNPDLGGFSAPGKMEEDKTISGLSYPAFIAQYIQKIHPEKLSSFENFGLLGTRTSDWLYLLGDSSAKLQDSERTFSLLKTIDGVSQNPFQNHIKKQFNNFSQEDLKYFRNKVKDANLITVSLGANDISSFNSIVSMIFLFLTRDKPTDTNDVKSFESQLGYQIQDALRNATNDIQNLKSNLKKVVKRIRGINNKANVNLIGYPLPFARLAKYFDSFINNPSVQGWLTKTLKQLNTAIKDVAKEENVNFIDAYDQSAWTKNPEKYAGYFYDLHPTTKGYKKMAQDILLKMISKEKLNPQWDDTFVNSDKEAKKPSIQFEDIDVKTITSKVLGTQNSELNADSSLESNPKVAKILKDNKNKGDISNIIRLYLDSKPRSVIDSPFFTVLQDIFNAPRALMQFFTDNSNLPLTLEMFTTFVNSNYIDTVFSQIETELNSKDLDSNSVAGTQNIDWDIIRKLFKEKALNVNNMFLFIKALLNSSFTKQNAEKAKDLYSWFINIMLFHSDVQKGRTTFSPLDPEREQLVANTGITNKIKPLSDNLVTNATTYGQHTTFVAFFKDFVTKNSDNLKLLFDEIIKHFVSKTSIILPSIKEFAKGLSIEITNESNINLDALVKDNGIYTKIKDGIVEGLKSIPDNFNSTFDDLYKEITKQIIAKLTSTLTQDEKNKVKELLDQQQSSSSESSSAPARPAENSASPKPEPSSPTTKPSSDVAPKPSAS